MKSVFLVSLLVACLFIPSALGQTVSLEIQGDCKEYNVTVSLEDFEPACYDVKVDVTTPAGRVGQIYDPREGWKSSIYYVNEGLCVEEANQTLNKMFQLRAETSSSQLSFEGKIRHGSVIWDTSYYDIIQDCLESSVVQDDRMFWLVGLLVVLVILAGIVMYVKVFRE